MKIPRPFFWIAPVLVGAALVSVYYSKRPIPSSTVEKKDSEVKASYWTCPMHPHIRSDKPGDCPICHMALVEMKSETSGEKANHRSHDPRSKVQLTERQMMNLSVKKTKAEKMNLSLQIPVSGRMLSSTTVAFQVYEADLRLIRPEQLFKIFGSSEPGVELTGRIESMDSIVDATSRTIRVTGVLDKNSRTLRVESSVSGSIEVELKDRLFIPADAVVHSGAEDLVYVFSSENTVSPKSVRLGGKAEGYFEVLDGLQVGDEVSAGANFLIDSESKIRGAGSDQTHHSIFSA